MSIKGGGVQNVDIDGEKQRRGKEAILADQSGKYKEARALYGVQKWGRQDVFILVVSCIFCPG